MTEHYKVYDLIPWRQYTPLPDQTVFSIPFALDAEEDFEAYFDDEETPRPASEYTITGAVRQTVTEETGTQGKVTFTVAPQSSGVTRLTITRLTSKDRLSDFPKGGKFKADEHNDELDRQTLMLKDIEQREGRSPRVPITDPLVGNLNVPKVSVRANKAQGYDDVGQVAVSESTLAQIDGAVAATVAAGAAKREWVFTGADAPFTLDGMAGALKTNFFVFLDRQITETADYTLTVSGSDAILTLGYSLHPMTHVLIRSS